MYLVMMFKHHYRQGDSVTVVGREREQMEREGKGAHCHLANCLKLRVTWRKSTLNYICISQPQWEKILAVKNSMSTLAQPSTYFPSVYHQCGFAGRICWHLYRLFVVASKLVISIVFPSNNWFACLNFKNYYLVSLQASSFFPSDPRTPVFEILEFHLIRQENSDNGFLKVTTPAVHIRSSETWTLAIMDQTATSRDSGFRTEPIVGGTAGGTSPTWKSPIKDSRTGVAVTISRTSLVSKILGTVKATLTGKRNLYSSWKSVDANQPNLLYLDSLLSVLKRLDGQQGISDMHLDLSLKGEWLPMMKEIIITAGSAAGQQVEGQDWARYEKVLAEPRFEYMPQSPPTKAWEDAEEKRILGDGFKLKR
ncbi:hypothetical protein EV359DRAFT_67644 [Lentinula novae-zelandiae]|nr:hypothetical protein EV359DRAFT_67644 [Lentinula novae-zelandiae]